MTDKNHTLCEKCCNSIVFNAKYEDKPLFCRLCSAAIATLPKQQETNEIKDPDF